MDVFCGSIIIFTLLGGCGTPEGFSDQTYSGLKGVYEVYKDAKGNHTTAEVYDVLMEYYTKKEEGKLTLEETKAVDALGMLVDTYNAFIMQDTMGTVVPAMTLMDEEAVFGHG